MATSTSTTQQQQDDEGREGARTTTSCSAASSSPRPSFHTSSLPRKHNHDAALTIADAFQEDPLFSKGFCNPRARFVMTYAIAASQIGSKCVSADMLLVAGSSSSNGVSTSTTSDGVSTSDILVDHDKVDDNGDGTTLSLQVRGVNNPVQSVCLWENNSADFKLLGSFQLFLRNMFMGFSMYFYLLKGAACTVGYPQKVGVLLNSILVFLYGVCTLWVIRFLLELVRFMIVYSYMVMKGGQFHKKYEKDHGTRLHGKRLKHLSMVGTLAASRGQGIGSALMRYTLQKLDDSNLYDYYYLESSNPKNVPFYERHGFVVIGEINVMGEKATFMIRKKPTSVLA